MKNHYKVAFRQFSDISISNPNTHRFPGWEILLQSICSHQVAIHDTTVQKLSEFIFNREELLLGFLVTLSFLKILITSFVFIPMKYEGSKRSRYTFDGQNSGYQCKSLHTHYTYSSQERCSRAHKLPCARAGMFCYRQ